MKKLIFLHVLLLCMLGQLFSQGRQITGKVIDAESRAPLSPATVNIIGKGISQKTDANGDFSISFEGKLILVVSYVGYKTATITVKAADSTLLVTLEKNVSDLDQVIVIGYGKQKKKDITSAISSVSAKEISELPVTSVNAAIQARVPG